MKDNKPERGAPDHFEYWDKIIEKIERLATGCKVTAFDPDILLSSEGKATINLPLWFVDCLIDKVEAANGEA